MLLLVPLDESASATDWEAAGLCAPANCWTMRDGCPARSGYSLTPGLRGPLQTSWSFQTRGEIEEEPRIWDEFVLVSEKVKEDRRVLHVVDLLHGNVVAKEPVSSEVALGPSVWNRVVVLRTGPRSLSAFRIYATNLKLLYRWELPGDCSEPVLLGRRFFLRVGSEIHGYRLGRAEPLWTTPGNFRGEVSVLGDHLFAVDYRGRMGELVWLDRETGEESRSFFVGQHGGQQPSRSSSTCVSLTPWNSIVRHSLPIETNLDRDDANCVFLQGSPVPPPKEDPASGVLSLERGPVLWEQGFLSLMQSEQGPAMLILDEVGDGRVLASKTWHSDFLNQPVPYTRTKDVLYAGMRGIDSETFEILWNEPETPPHFRVVPGRETALVVDRPNQLTAWRPAASVKRPRFHELPEASSEGAGSTNWKGTLVFRDGSVHQGEFTVSPWKPKLREVVIRARSKKSSASRWTLEELLVAIDDDHRLLYAGPEDDFLWGLELLVESRTADAYAELAAEAAGANDPELLERLLGEATRRGTQEWLTVSRAETKLSKMHESIDKGRPPKRKDRVAESVENKESEVTRLPIDFLWKEIEALPESAPDTVLLDLLRTLVEREPDHEGAATRVREQLPDDTEPPQGFDALEWIDFLEAIRHTQITMLHPDLQASGWETEQALLQQAQQEWRTDLVGIRSPRLLVITPLHNPGRIARCLAMGELVCESLEELFISSSEELRGTDRPMTLYLYESQQEYLGNAGASAAFLEWSSGHYSPTEGLEKIFLPTDKDAFERVMDTYAHELTHHWILERCPTVTNPDPRAAFHQPGFWIVEGLASLLGSFDFRPREKSYRFDALPECLDLLANAPSGDLIAWNDLFQMSQKDFAMLPSGEENSLRIPLARSLGLGRQIDRKSLFYVQAEAACQYLFHHSRGTRNQLLQYIGDYYGARTERTTISGAFGTSGSKLGTQVEDFARTARDQFRISGAAFESAPDSR